MSTHWKITPDWAGATVAVLGSGPSMSRAVADALRQHRCIAVNLAVRAAPWADMAVALDVELHATDEFRNFPGLRVVGTAHPDVDALCPGLMYERVTLGPGNQIEFRNSGLAAIRIAAAMGASRIILAGFDPEARGHFYDDEVDTGDGPDPYFGVAAGLAAITAEFAARGIVVERYAPAVQTPAATVYVDHHHV